MITTHLPTTPTTLAWACILAEAFETKHPRMTHAMRRYSRWHPETWSPATKAAYRYADHEVARRLVDPPQDAGVVQDDPVDVATALFFLPAVNPDLVDRAAAELAGITASICTGPLTWEAVFPDDSLRGALTGGLIAPDQLEHAELWLAVLKLVSVHNLFHDPDPHAQGLCLRDAQALLVLAVLAVRSLPEPSQWIQRRRVHRTPSRHRLRQAPMPT